VSGEGHKNCQRAVHDQSLMTEKSWVMMMYCRLIRTWSVGGR